MTNFLMPEDNRLAQEFLRQGWVIVGVNPAAIRQIHDLVVAKAHQGILGYEPKSRTDIGWLNKTHQYIPKDINDYRLSVYNAINGIFLFRHTYYMLAPSDISALVGNELAMQRRINLSIQLPNDESSLLPTHTDVWSGDSPYEVVLWVPLVDCHKTKSMWIMPDRQTDAEIRARMDELGSMQALEEEIKDKRVFLRVPFGNAVIFTPTMMHGNVVNREPETRWSLNCRFKSLLSPYADKKLGEFFEPITIRPVTRIGMGEF